MKDSIHNTGDGASSADILSSQYKQAIQTQSQQKYRRTMFIKAAETETPKEKTKEFSFDRRNYCNISINFGIF